MDYPVIMSAPMVLATLREIEAPGTGKTMTRRIRWRGPLAADGVGMRESSWARVRPGDRLWVREQFWHYGHWSGKKTGGDVRYSFVPDRWHGEELPLRNPSIVHAADAVDTHPRLCGKFGDPKPAWHLRPSIFLPREESRITLIVTATKIERLHEIRNADCIAEGCEVISTGPDGSPMTFIKRETASYHQQTVRAWFHRLWDERHGDGAWDANPDVVAITFRPVLANIDSKEMIQWAA